MREIFLQFRDFFVSLKLTVVLLVLSIILVFWATLDQVNLGIWAVQEKYFRTFFVLWRFGEVPVPVFPGGYFIGGLLLVNLVAAHVYRLRFTWRKLGIQMTHVGLILLLVGELLTGLWQEEFRMAIDEGQTKNYSESYRNNELAIVDTTDPQFDDVIAIPETLLDRGEPVEHAKLPFRIVTKTYYPNAAVQPRGELSAAPASPATQGVGPRAVVTPLPLTYQENERNLPAAFLELVGAEGSLGTWLVSPMVVAPQTLEYGGRTWRIELRFERQYKPFSLTLLDFSHDRYAGTEIPKNFSSRLRLTTPDGRDDRDVLIYMNNPLRYAGLTFYQASFDNNDRTTVLQVVRNPSWLLPYIACGLMGVGLLLQFGLSLFGFVSRRRATPTAAAA